MHALKTVVAAVAASLALGACAASGGAPPGGVDRPAVVREPPTVRVENHNWQDVVVYVVGSGLRTRLGMVTSMNRAVFRLPRHVPITDNLRLMADPVGSVDGFVSESILVSPGQEIGLQVHSHLAMSSIAVFNQ